MSVEVNVVGMRCGAKAGGLSCTYCYQGSVRNATANAAPTRVDHDAIQRAILEATPGAEGFSVFGGEALLASVEDLERLWAFGLERYGTNGVQTSGRPIREEHFALFKRYKVNVGFSIDGPEELNDARVAGSREATRLATCHAEASLRRCLAEGVSASLIVTLHALNASAQKLSKLLAWLRGLDAAGLRSARVHVLELDGPGKALALSSEDNVSAFLALREMEKTLAGLRFDVFADVEAKLRDPDAAATCVWSNCDPWTTTAVHGIEADGGRSLCQRVHKDGRSWLPAEGGPDNIRTRVLWRTPQERGGCSGCRFFLQCGGQCPGTAIDGDWRKRSRDCPTWFAILEHVEREMLARGEKPASLAPDLAERIERRLATGITKAKVDHGDRPHGDAPHGDHTDLAV